MKKGNEKLKECLKRWARCEDAALEEEMKNSEPHVFSEDFKAKMAKMMTVRTKETADEKLAASILRVMNQEEEAIQAEIKKEGPHVFSEEFEKKLEKVMEVRARKAKRYNVMRYAAAMIVTFLLVGGILFVGNEEARASKVGIDILEWMENFFLVDEGDTTRKEDEVLFAESQIEYLPEGFEKVEELVMFSKVSYRYQNADGDYVVLEVYRDKTSSGIDNEDVGQEVNLNVAGLEYRFIDKDEENSNAIAWTDKEEIYYYLTSTLEKEEVINIMNGISY